MHRLADVGRQLAERLHHLPRPLGGALDDEALVELHQLGGAGFAQQVVADGNAHGIETMGVQTPVDERRIHGDVPVVGDEQVALLLFQMLKPGEGHPLGGGGDHPAHVAGHPHLHLMDGGHLGPLVAQELADQRANGPAQPAHQGAEAILGDGANEFIIPDQPLDGCRYFLIAVGANVRESIYFCHNVSLACKESRPACAGRKIQGAILHAFMPRGMRRSQIVRSDQ